MIIAQAKETKEAGHYEGLIKYRFYKGVPTAKKLRGWYLTRYTILMRNVQEKFV